MRDFDLSMLELLQCCRGKCFDFVYLCKVYFGDILYWDIFVCDVEMFKGADSQPVTLNAIQGSVASFVTHS